MNYNRRRNIFTLGDFHQYPNPTQQIKAQHNRRQNSDPFERDPFKIQSYNFRYAERPSYPLPNLGQNRTHSTQPSTSSSTHKRFETFFYNYDFAPSVHDKENPPANKFREFRRRKFLLDHQQQNSTAAGMYGQATNSRQSSMLQQNFYQQQLHPIVNGTTGYGRNGASASQTAIATAATSAAAAAANAFNHGGRMRGNDNSGRHHQTFDSATDTSSIGTAAGQRVGRDYGSTSPRMSSQQKCGRPTSARSTGNREYLRALATAHIGATAQPNYLGRGRCSSRSSLERGRRMRTEPLGNGGGGVGGNGQSNNTYGQSYGNARGAGFRELSGSRASPSKYAATARQPLQTAHTPSPNRVTATVEQTAGACSGCQININIKGLDSTQLGDNVVIKIESDKNTPPKSTTSKTEQFPAVISALNNIYNGVGTTQHRSGNDIAYAKLIEIKRNSEVNQNLDIKPKTSGHQLQPPPPPLTVSNSTSANFVIDKRLSKFAMTTTNTDGREQRRKNIPRSSSHSRIPVTSSTIRAMGLTASTTAIRTSNSTENIQRIPPRSISKERIAKSISKERMPSMVPWCLDTTTVRQGFSANDDVKSQSSNLLKNMRPSYDATLNDIRQKRRQAVLAAYKPLPLQRTSNSPSRQMRKADNFDGGAGNGRQRVGGAAVGSDKKMPDKKSPGAAAATTFPNSNGVQRRQSHHSLRSLKPSKSTLHSQFSSQLDVGYSPTIIMRRSRSCIRPEEVDAARQHAMDSQSHLSVKTTPLNVNINVFADKLKLLRV